MNKLAAYRYVHAMSKAASVALRVKRAAGMDIPDNSSQLSEEDFNNMKRIYTAYINKQYLRDVALNQYMHYLRNRNTSTQPVPIGDVTVND